jgi:hypothetical protein
MSRILRECTDTDQFVPVSPVPIPVNRGLAGLPGDRQASQISA